MAKFAFHDKLKNFIKQFPGCNWVPDVKGWTVPMELAHRVRDKAEELGFEVEWRTE